MREARWAIRPTYLDTNEWQVAGITKALSSLDRGKGIAHARVSEWVASWETRKERLNPLLM